MTPTNDNAPLTGHGQEGAKKSTRNQLNTKSIKMLRVILARGRNGLHCIQAVKIGDTCLHSTVSVIQKRWGLTLAREWVCVPNGFNTHTRVVRYFIAPDQIPAVKKILSGEDD